MTKLSKEAAEVLRNPTIEGARKFWPSHIPGMPASANADDDTILGGIHKARLKWKGSTKEMKEISRLWLAAHGFEPTIFGK